MGISLQDHAREISKIYVKHEVEIERLTDEVQSAYFAGYEEGHDDSFQSQPKRVENAFKRWTRDSGKQEKTCAGCGCKWHHDSVWCPDCAIKRAAKQGQK